MVVNFLLSILMNVNTTKLAAHAQTSKFLWDRQAQLKPLFENGDVDRLLGFYHQDLEFSDHARQARNLDKAAFEKFLRLTYETASELRMETHGVHGTKEFSVWEWTLKVVLAQDDPIRGLAKGKERVLRGCSLHWWKVREGGSPDAVADWQIVKEEDYACGGDGLHLRT